MSLIDRCSALIHNDHNFPCGRFRRLNTIHWLVSVSMSLLLASEGQGWSQTVGDQDTAKGTIVAAGFGYQIGDTSTITVKVYDAVSGEVLSDDTFELNVKDEGSRSNPSQERIFAGGVGLGATDLSNFILRVYDAKTGTFQWEGHLNLTPIDGSGGGRMVSTVAPRRATVTKIHALDTAMRQPSFLLRALDPTTGGLVWEDEFSTDGARSGRVDRIANRLIGQSGESPDISHTFDFRIRMFDSSGQGILWEDQFAQQEAEEEAHEAVDDHASMLPAWPRLIEQNQAPQAI